MKARFPNNQWKVTKSVMTSHIHPAIPFLVEVNKELGANMARDKFLTICYSQKR